MPAIDLVIDGRPAVSVREKQVCSMFDVPPDEASKLHWKGDVPLDSRPWSVGLIVGPSGSGKSTVARNLFGRELDAKLEWNAHRSLIDDFGQEYSVEQISAALGSVGLNTIPAWLRPYEVLSNGEKFRADIARRLLELGDLCVVDEFTSVVDRQVAKIGSHAVQKHVRKQSGKRFVAVSCHYDIADWLQPDWVLEPATMTFAWRSVQPRPRLNVEIKRVPYCTWRLFAPYHYLTSDLNQSARCFAAHVDGRPVAFAGMIHFPHPTVGDIERCSRLVTLPDWQGLGLAFALIDTIARAYKAVGKRTRTYPAHPALIRSFDRASTWSMVKEAGTFQAASGKRARLKGEQRPCATFEWRGDALPRGDASRLLGSSESELSAMIKHQGKAARAQR